MKKLYDWGQQGNVRKRISILFLVIPITLSAQRFGLAQTPGLDDAPEGNIPVQQSLLPVDVLSLEKPIDPDTYILGPGDQIAISVQTSTTLEKVLSISPTGFLMIPGIGKVDLRNKFLREATERIDTEIKQNYKNAKVSSELVGIRRFIVSVVGAVRSPGYYTVTPVTRLSNVLRRAHPRPMALLNQIVIVSDDGDRKTYDINKFYVDGNLSQNPTMVEGNQIQIEYGELDQHAIVVRGAVTRRGYDFLNPSETLGDLIARRIDFNQSADLENIKVVRKADGRLKFITVKPEEFNTFRLQPGDDIEFLYEKPVNVQGHVAASGSFSFIPGYTAADYVTLAGGLLPSGTMNGIKITRVDGTVLHGEDVVIQRGDIIEVPRSWMNLMVGDVTVLQLITTMATLILTYQATLR